MKLPTQAIYDIYRRFVRNPKYRWWIAIATVGYLILPFDFAPDMIPFVGQIDDAVVVTLLATELSQVLVSSLKNKRNKGANASNPIDPTIVNG